jgi:hypothetical protein
MKIMVFLDATPCSLVGSIKVPEKPGASIFMVEADSVSLQPPAHAGSSLEDFSTLKMEAKRSSETSVHIRPTQRHIPEDGILQ